MQHLIQASPLFDKLNYWQKTISLNEIKISTSQKVVLWSIGVVGTSVMVVGVLSRYLARRRAKPIINPRIQRAINKRISRMRSPNGGMGSVASSGGRSSPLGYSERLSLASGSIGSGGGDAAPLSPQQLGVMAKQFKAMAPPRRILKQQLEILMNFLEENKEMSKGLIPGTPVSHQETRKKWASLAKRLNAVQGGALKTPDGWKKYWFEWRHKCRKKARRKIQRDVNGDSDKCIPFNELEVRALELSGEGMMGAPEPIPKPDNDVNDDSDSMPLENIRHQVAPVKDEEVNPVVNNIAMPGMEALVTSINYWEDALAAFSLGARGGVTGTLALTTPEEAEFCREIQDLLQNSYLLQERCELLFLDQRSVLFRSESGGEIASGADGRRTRLLSTHTASSHTKREHHSSAESFASAEDQVADLREFDDLTECLPELENLELYQAAVKQLEVGIPYRTLRTEVVQCSTDSEFLCKLYCLRLAFQMLFKDTSVWSWFVDAGRQVLTDLLLFADKEPKEFLVAYEEMVTWATDGSNWTTIESELTSKGVKALTFYDVVLDYILLDAFEDLASPPTSVLAVVRNRWLSDGFKESALTTAVWSVIKAKRRYLKYPDGFMAHFYSISEHLLPVLVWGFLGPQERLRDMCITFQAEIVGFIADLFSFHKCRYTNMDDLAVDIMQHAKTRSANITDKLAERN